MLVNIYLEQACYSSNKLYSGHSFNLHLNSVFLSIGIRTLSYLINKMHCQPEHASRAESSTANLCSFLPPASWRHIKVSAWSLGSGNPELLGNSESQTSGFWAMGLAHWAITVHTFFVIFLSAQQARLTCSYFSWVYPLLEKGVLKMVQLSRQFYSALVQQPKSYPEWLAWYFTYRGEKITWL